MGASWWIASILFFISGLYLIAVELGLENKTPLIYAGIVFLIPLIFRIIFKIIR